MDSLRKFLLRTPRINSLIWEPYDMGTVFVGFIRGYSVALVFDNCGKAPGHGSRHPGGASMQFPAELHGSTPRMARALPGRFPTIVENKSLHATGEPQETTGEPWESHGRAKERKESTALRVDCYEKFV